LELHLRHPKNFTWNKIKNSNTKDFLL